MGCCCSCFDDISNGASGGSSSSAPTKETEMAGRAANGEGRKTLSISRAMTAPTIEVKENATVSGYGLALVGVTIEQDAAYWEIHVEIPSDAGEVACELMAGVATKKDRKFYNAMDEQEEESPDTSGTDLMKKIPVSNGDTVGVAVQQSDLPMIQFMLNGEPLHTLSINRFRGTVYPSIFLPENDGVSARMVFDERQFQQISPHARFGPIIVARGLL